MVVLRNGVEVDDPLAVLIGYLDAGWVDAAPCGRPASFDESDLRRANRGGARISAAQIAVILERRGAIERALRAIPADASLLGVVPWPALRQLFQGFADVKGVGFAKMTKTLHPKRPALVPMLDSVVQAYLEGDDPGAGEPFAERAIALVRGYKRDLDSNRRLLRMLRRETSRRGHDVTEVRILDLLIWSVRSH